MAEEIFRLLRSLSRRFDARDSRRAQNLRSDDTDGEMADHRNALTSPALPAGTGRFEFACPTDDETSSPTRRSTMAEKGRPQASLSAPDTTTSENLCEPYSQSIPAHRDAHSELAPMQGGHTQNYLISVERPDIGRTTDLDPMNSATREEFVTNCQLKVPKHVIQIDDVDHEGILITPQAIPRYTKPIQAQNTPRTRDLIPDGSKEPYRHTPQNPATVIDKGHTTCHRRPSLNLSVSSSEGNYEAYPFRQPVGTSTSDPEAKLDANYTRSQGYTITRSHSTPNREEPFTGRDARLVPDRGKSFRRS